MRNRLLAAAFVVLSISFAGCGSGKAPPKMAMVKGKVTLDAKPLESGKITFDGNDGSVPTVIEIKGGVYEGQTTVGEKKVRITSYKIVAMPKTGMTGPEYDNQKVEENFIPARFNTDTKEVRTIKEEGPNEFDFGVMSK
jgi:hypothetical protein